MADGPDRIGALDGLRGLAALAVVLEHVLLVNPSLVGETADPARYPTRGTLPWWLMETPLHLLWAGGEAVFVFFVLSGVVLVLPHLKHDRISAVDWFEYYPRRIVRLYVPVLAALVIAVPLMLAFGRAVVSGVPWWNAADRFDLSPRSVLSEATLLGTPGRVIPALWSLEWEVLFSLLLPLYLVLGRRVRTLPAPLVILGILGAVFAGVYTGVAWLTYLPIFGLGVLLAEHRERALLLCSRLRTGQWLLLSAAAVVLLLNRWLISAVPALSDISQRGRFSHMTIVPAALGAVLAVVIAWQWAPLARFLTSGPAHWLGVRSYSLYVIHMPIVVVVANTFGGWNPLSIPIVTVCSLLAAHLLHRFVEVPSIRWSRAVGRWASSRGVRPLRG